MTHRDGAKGAPMRATCLCLAAGIILLSGCRKKTTGTGSSSPSLTSRPLPERASISGQTLFQRLDPEATGVDFVAPIDTTHPLKFLYNGGYACGGVCVGDLNADGKPDLFFVGGSGANRLYLQTGELVFTDVSSEASIDGGDSWGGGAALVDIDGDGDLDIYVCHYNSANHLFINEGNDERGTPRFNERAGDFGLDLVDASLMSAFCDYDSDGDLDVYVLCYRLYRPKERSPADLIRMTDAGSALRPGMEEYYQLHRNDRGQLLVMERGRADYLFRNDGGRFTDATKSAGIGGNGFGMSCLWWDYDSDGWVDLYVANDLQSPDQLYRNLGNGTFAEVIREAVPHTTWFSMGTAAGDVNNDGRADLFALDMSASTHFKEKVAMGEMTELQKLVLDHSEPRQNMRNALFINTGTGRMAEAAYLAGLARTDWSWAPVFGDFDEDGRLDLFVTNGMTRNFMDSDLRVPEAQKAGKYEWDHYEASAELREENFAFRNEGDLRFDDHSVQWGLDQAGMSFAAASGDLDGDGDLDLVVANLTEPPYIYENRANEGHRITLELYAAPDGLSSGIGSKVTLRSASAGIQSRGLQPMQGFNASHQPLLHFGLGADTRVEELTVTWPDDSSETFQDLAADRHYTIRQTPRSRPTKRPAPKPLFERSDLLAGAAHRDEPYDDFQHQPLLPNRYSQLGPAIAWGDIDGDGDQDFFVGGAAGHSAQLYTNDGDGKFVKDGSGRFDADKDCEDTGAVFFDADRDGDLDLYVASGSYEFPEGDRALRDRLYLNDGNGILALASAELLPEIRKVTGPVAACDFDRDGDVDLFVGARLVSRQFPVAPRCVLLINEGGSFSRHPDPPSPGLVTGALWSDVNNDGWSDLLITCEWGPVWLVRNARGNLESPVAIAESGWWNSISPGDIDNDGDLDYVVGNFGLNTKYDPPVVLYYGDYADDGRRHLVEAKREQDSQRLLPIRGKSCTTAAMPYLAEKFDSFRAFAGASLSEIYTDLSLQSALKLELNELRSGILHNQGDGEFSFSPLPRLAQIAPVMGTAFCDFDGDGNLDLCLAENYFAPQRETGRMDGGIGAFLSGDGQGNFTPMPARDSGIVVPGAAKSLTVADLDGDLVPDLVFATNNGPIHAFVNHVPSTSFLLVDLSPPLPGTHVCAVYSDGRRQAAQIASGSGYLSQSAPSLWFGKVREIESLEITWPDGTTSVHHATPDWRAAHRCVLTKSR